MKYFENHEILKLSSGVITSSNVYTVVRVVLTPNDSNFEYTIEVSGRKLNSYGVPTRHTAVYTLVNDVVTPKMIWCFFQRLTDIEIHQNQVTMMSNSGHLVNWVNENELRQSYTMIKGLISPEANLESNLESENWSKINCWKNHKDKISQQIRYNRFGTEIIGGRIITAPPSLLGNKIAVKLVTEQYCWNSNICSGKCWWSIWFGAVLPAAVINFPYISEKPADWALFCEFEDEWKIGNFWLMETASIYALLFVIWSSDIS